MLCADAVTKALILCELSSVLSVITWPIHEAQRALTECLNMPSLGLRYITSHIVGGCKEKELSHVAEVSESSCI